MTADIRPGSKARFVRASDVLTTELASRELVMLDIERGLYFGVEGVARLVWEALGTPVTVAELVDRVCADYPEIDPTVCEDDVREFLESLRQHRLVHPEGDRSGR